MRAFLVIAALWAGIPLHAGRDSLLQVLQGLPVDTARLPVLRALFKAEVLRRPDSALVHARAYASIAIRQGTPYQRAQGEAMQGHALYVMGRGVQALPHFQRALAGLERSGPIVEESLVRTNIASIQADAGRWEAALIGYRRALAGFRRAGEHTWAAGVLPELAAAFEALGMRDSAIHYYARATEALELQGLADHARDTRLDEAGLLLEEGQARDAWVLYVEANPGEQALAQGIVAARLLLRSGERARAQGRLPHADSLFHAALERAVAGGFIVERVAAYQALAELNELRAAPDSALHYLKLRMQWGDTLHNARGAAEIARLEARSAAADAHAELAQRNAVIARHRLQLGAVGAALAVVLVAGILLFIGLRRERRHAQRLAERGRAVEEALAAKDLLLREVHHRVKNNLQMVGSLLRMQGRGIQDPVAREAVRDSQDRVRSMALIHQDLYQEDDVRGIDMRPYVEKLARGLVASHGIAAHRITIVTDVPTLRLDVDSAIPIGLILNELIVNALKHAFPGDRKGTLRVALNRSGNALHLEVSDDGIGWAPAGGSADGGGGFGLGMLRTFAEKLQAEQEMIGGDGTTVRLRIRNFKLTG